MNEFLAVSEITINPKSIDEVYLHLQKCGSNKLEGVALWAGVIDHNRFIVKETIIPQQKGSRTEEGLLYTVEGEELHRINIWLYQNKMTMMVQIHSHPGQAYHSETDDRYPIISQFGGISIVIPNFGFDKFSLDRWAVYRLYAFKGWTELSDLEKRQLFKIF